MRRVAVAALCAAALWTTGCGDRFYTEAPVADGGKGASSETTASGLTVTVIDTNSRPVTGATVSIINASGKVVGAPVTSGAGGAANFKGLPTGAGYRAIAQLGSVQATHELDIEGEGPVLVSVMLAAASGPRGTIGGTIFDGYTGQALHGATVSVVGTQITTQTNPDGSYLLKDVPVGNPTVVTIYPGFKEQRIAITLRAGQLGQATMRLAPGANPQRMGHTLVATGAKIVEVNSTGATLWATKKGGSQARILANGNVLVAGTNGVNEISASGAIVWRYTAGVFGALSDPQGAWRASSGNTFIADTGNSRVIEVSPKQQIRRTVKLDVERPSSVERIEGARPGTLIADTGHNRVVEINDQGQIAWGFGSGDPADLNKPVFATRLPNGNTLVCDTGNSRVLEITPAYKAAWIYGGDGQRATCFLPNSALRLPNGNTLIADTGNHRVIEVDRAGQIAWNLAIEDPRYAARF